MMDIHNAFMNKICVSTSASIWYGSESFKFNPRLIETRMWSENELSQLFVEYFSCLFCAMCPGKQDTCEYWLDDTPYCILNAKSLKKIFPHSKFIHIHRDPRSVVASYLLQDWGGDKSDVENIARRVKTVYEKIDHQKRGVSESDFVSVKFESLLRNPIIEMQAIAQKINFTFDENSLKLVNKNKTKGYEGFFSNQQLSVINTILEHEIHKLGYLK